jgi:1,4-alpha-glucan branching enzyme
MVKIETGKNEARASAKKSGKVAAPKARQVPIEYFAPEANTVAVAGEFNQWNPQADMLKKTKAGWWRTSVRLAPGRYQYRFVIDGEQWAEDPENPLKELNEFDSYNSVLEVR